MTERKMTNAELLARLDERFKSLAEQQAKTYEEVKKTNGRVTALETWRSEMKGGWKATTVISAAVGAVAGFLVKVFI